MIVFCKIVHQLFYSEHTLTSCLKNQFTKSKLDLILIHKFSHGAINIQGKEVMMTDALLCNPNIVMAFCETHKFDTCNCCTALDHVILL